MTTPPSLPRPILKKPKLEHDEQHNDDRNTAVSFKQNEAEEEDPEEDTDVMMNDNNDVSEITEQEEALIALIEHRTKEVQHLGQRISYYQSQREAAEIRLQDSQSKLARLRTRHNGMTSKSPQFNEIKSIKEEPKPTSPVIGPSHTQPRTKPTSPVIGSSHTQPRTRTELLIPCVNPETSLSRKSTVPPAKPSTAPSARAIPSTSTSGMVKVKTEKSHRTTPDLKDAEHQEKGLKRKLEEKQHKELIPSICSTYKAGTMRFNTSNYFSGQHKRKLRSLALCPVNDQLFVTSALDGLVNLWQLQSRGLGASLLTTTDCASPVERRWPEDIAWHPDGNSLFCVYTADAKDSQISIINLNKTQKRDRVTFLEDKPHTKGIINSLIFLPRENSCFVTGGSDHAVIIWTGRDAESSWKPKTLHRNLHSSAVMGVSGMHQKPIVVSVGADKRIIGFNVDNGRADFRHQIDSKCMSVLTNPCDFNLFMVQTGTHEKQLRLFDIRLRQTEVHAFGWKQESSDSQSALINQSWSPDGLYITSGSADPKIHIFDIRYNARKPCHSLSAHQKRVFKAEWHFFHPLLISISSDYNIGLHKLA